MTANVREGRERGTGDRVAFGVALVLLSTVFTSLTDVIFKLVSGSGSIWQFFVLRSVLAIPVLLGFAWYWGEGLSALRHALRVWPMMRSLLFVLMFTAAYTALPVLPLATLAAGLYTAPLFVAGFSALLTGERVGIRGWFAIALGFAGVLAVLRPGSDAFTWYTLLPVLGGLCYALAALVTRSKCRDVSATSVAIALNVAVAAMGLVFSGMLLALPPDQESIALAPSVLGPWQAFGPQEWGFVVILAALMVGSALTVSAAYQAAPSAIVVTFDYNYLICMVFFGYVFFKEIPDWGTVIGMLMIVGAGLTIIRK